MDIAVIGGGSIGLLVSSYVAVENKVTLYVKRSEQVRAIKEQHIHVLKHSIFHHKLKVDTKLINEMDVDHQLYIVCVKQTQVSDVLEYLLPVNAPIIFLQNGMGHINKVQQLNNRVYLGVVSHGANRTQDYEVNILGEGSIHLASFTGKVEELKCLTANLNASNFPVVRVGHWQDLLKDKLIVNAVINPLTALFDVPNGQIYMNPYIILLAKKICEETAYVLGMSSAMAWKKVQQTAEATKQNTSSMRADIQHQRQTEIEAITGYILKQSDIELPFTEFIYHAILALQQEGV